jgi:Secretion system C-terminal sorting domain
MFKFSSKYFTLFLLLIAFCQNVAAQFQVVPVRNVEVSKKSSGKTAALSLPFFDDFSTSNIKADPQKWVKGGGTFINNNASLSHPTLNMVTFDGLRANGVPYNFNDSFNNGATDSLTSQPIDISKPTIRDSLYLSFFYQSQGLGEVSDANDSLIVEFLTNGDKWETAFVAKDGKHIIGKDTTKIDNKANFIQVLLPVNATKYLHDKFQFRFRTFGRQSGQFDVWHIDYVYLDKIRANPLFQRYNPISKRLDFYDYAFKSEISPILKNYNAMPLTQFLAKPENEMSGNIGANVYSLWTENIVTSAFTVTNLLNGKIIISPTAKKDTLSTNVDYNQTTSFVFKNTLADLLKNETGTKLTLKAKFSMNSGDYFRMNDTISRIVELDNYYAYDDGTAESGAYLKRGFGRAAIQFINNKPDVVKAIRINLQTLLDSTRLATTTLSLQVMANDKGKPGRILRGMSGKITYPSTNNGFVEYAIEPVAVTDTFYVGYTQLSDDEALVVGVDNNSPQFAKNHFYNITNEWINVSSIDPKNSGFIPIQGSLMIRPVMGGIAKEITLTTEEEIQDRNLVISPNPTYDIIRWNDTSLKKAEIIDMSGRSISSQKSDNQEINISNLNSGTYILRLSNDKNTFVRKIVKL